MASATGRPEAVLQGLLCLFSRGIYRTKLVKLVYLLDENYYRLCGKTMTGFRYEWSHYGPNAVGNAIVDTLDRLVKVGAISMVNLPTPKGTAYLYQIVSDFDPVDLPLSADEWAGIYSVKSRYGKMNTEQIVRESKATTPARKGRQYDALKFEQRSSLTQQEIDADPLWKETVDAIENPGKSIDIKKLRRVLV